MNTDGHKWRRLFNDPIFQRFDYVQLSRDKRNDFSTNSPTSITI